MHPIFQSLLEQEKCGKPKQTAKKRRKLDEEDTDKGSSKVYTISNKSEFWLGYASA